MKETVEINLETLTKQVEEGMKKDELAKHYGLPVAQMTKALKEAGLKIRKFHKPAFKLVDSVATEEIANVPVVEAPEGDAPAPVVEDGPAPDSPEPATAENIWKN